MLCEFHIILKLTVLLNFHGGTVHGGFQWAANFVVKTRLCQLPFLKLKPKF